MKFIKESRGAERKALMDDLSKDGSTSTTTLARITQCGRSEVGSMGRNVMSMAVRHGERTLRADTRGGKVIANIVRGQTRRHTVGIRADVVGALATCRRMRGPGRSVQSWWRRTQVTTRTVLRKPI